MFIDVWAEFFYSDFLQVRPKNGQKSGKLRNAPKSENRDFLSENALRIK